jgi:NitT/TauT family transport system substrate-binding protein
MRRRDRRSFLIASGGLLLAAACGSGSSGSRESSPPDAARGPVKLRLGYFPNVTHAQPNVGLERGTYQQILGDDVRLETKTFNAGPTVIEAIFAGELDAGYIGPNPAINGYVQSQGKEIRIVSGATSAGALFIIRPDRGINSAKDFANKKIATPQLGNTQDVALRAWLKTNGLNAMEQGGNVRVLPTANADTLTLFRKGEIDGAWVPEPWATRLVQEAEGKVYLDERTLWPNGDFVTTHLIVRTRYVKEHPDAVERLLRAHVEVTDLINAGPAEAKALLNRSIEKITGAALPTRVIDGAWPNMRITFDPIASSLKKSADDAAALGFLEKKPDLSSIYDLTLLNKVLKDRNLPEVKGLG